MEHMSVHITDLIRAHKDPATILNLLHETYVPVDKQKWNLFLVDAIQFQHDLLVTHLLNVEHVEVCGNDLDGFASARPLNAAVCVGRMDYVVELLQRGADVNRRAGATIPPATEVSSAVEFALRDDRLDFLMLFEPHFDRGLHGCSLLNLACQFGSYQCAQHLLMSPVHHADVNTMDTSNNNFTPLMYAVRHNVKLVQLLLDHCASPLFITPVGGYTVLHAATMDYMNPRTSRIFLPTDLPVIICILLNSGCDVNAKTSEGETALCQLCSQVYTETSMYSSNIGLPYDVHRHQAIVTVSVTILLKHGAKSHIEGCIALDVVMRYTQMFLNMLDSGSLTPCDGTVVALTTCRDILSLVSQHESCVFGCQVVGFISTILVTASRLCSRSAELMLTGDCISTVVRVVCDVVRLLLLASVDSDYDAVTVQLCQCHYSDMELFGGVLELVLNVVDEGRAWRCTDNILCCMANELDDGRKQEVLSCVKSVLHRPRSLRQQSRCAILDCLNAAERIRIISSLHVLPQMMIDYVLSLKN